MRVHTDCETWHGMTWYIERILFEVHVVEEEVAVLNGFKYMQVVCRVKKG